MDNQSDIQPGVLHGDTHAQSTPVFGLAHLLGIKLMPRIRNIADLKFFKPDKNEVLEHINQLFSDPIKWELIHTHYKDMMRITMSIKQGKIKASTILRRLGSKSRKNRLYFAFRELGRVMRTQFLMEYINDVELRKTIQAATCKSEEFNEFAKSLFFWNFGIIKENDLYEQQKVVKFNHLLANLVILHNVNSMSQVLAKLKESGVKIDDADLSFLSPYRRDHINTMGLFNLDLKRKVPPFDPHLLPN